MKADRFEPGDLNDPDWVLWACLAVALALEAERTGGGWVERGRRPQPANEAHVAIRAGT